jgi:glyoxylase-like metal-dependent hydrolase (beta-lactamase superfamily II)
VLLNERYLFCGETLLCRGLPVPDVTCPGGHDWARLLHASVQRLALLPDDTFVFPGRFTTPADVDAEKGVQARLGDMRETETLTLADEGEEAFVERVMELQPESWGDVHLEILRINARQRGADDESEITRLEAGAGGFDLPVESAA